MRDPAAEKRRLRPLLRARRAAIDTDRRLAAARLLRDLLLDSSPWSPDAVVAGYWPMGAEMDVQPVLEALAKRGHRCALPVVAGSGLPLTFREWRPMDRLVAAGFGTSEPSPERPRVSPSVLLVPLLAFDARGFRLGYGGGYYDRTLTAMRGCGEQPLALGVGFAAQEMEALPVEEFDQRLDMVATESGLRRFAGAP
jgi:5-formyltetrahydrofolate cyclo-ligase